MMIYRLISKVLKIQVKFRENSEYHDVIEDQLRCIIKYLMYKFIGKKKECTVREISDKFGILENTVYKYVKIGVKGGYIKKINNDADQRKTQAHFILAAQPKVKEFLEEYENIISAFYLEIILKAKDL